MQIDPEKLKVVHNTQANRFETEFGGHTAVLEYELDGNRMVFTHTGVPEPLEGQGVASQIARTALDYAREHGLKVVPACEFMRVYIRRHRDYRDLVAD